MFALWERDELANNIYAFGGDPFKFATIMLHSIAPDKFRENWYELNAFIDELFGLNFNRFLFDEIEDIQARDYMKSEWTKILRDPYFIVSDDTYRDNICNDGLVFSLPNIIGNCFGHREFNKNFYTQAGLENEFSLLGCLRRICEQYRLSITLKDAEEQFIGLSRDADSGSLKEVIVDATQIRVQPLS